MAPRGPFLGRGLTHLLSAEEDAALPDDGFSERYDRAARSPRKAGRDGPLQGCAFVGGIIFVEALLAALVGWWSGSWTIGVGTFAGVFILSLLVSIRL